MVNVENSLQTAPVKIGFGREVHHDDLRRAGAERVWSPADRAFFFDKLDLVLRTDDTLVLAQPKILSLAEMKRISDLGVSMQVIGHEPVLCQSYEDRRGLRNRKPRAEAIPIVETRGRPSEFTPPTKEQVAAIINDWHSGMKRALVVERAALILGRPVAAHWVRDLMIKHTGSAARDPHAAGKRPSTETE